MLKLFLFGRPFSFSHSAAFGRLCVETNLLPPPRWVRYQPPSGGCVLKPHASALISRSSRSAAFGRLCVETLVRGRIMPPVMLSRLRAAVC